MSRTLLTVLFAIVTFSTAAFALSHNEQIIERIKPIGDVYLASNEPVVEVPTGPRTGEQVYNTFCIACHATGISDAPKIGNAADWAPRLAQGQDVVRRHAIEGLNIMPPKGTCMDCSDDELFAAIEHMTAGL